MIITEQTPTNLMARRFGINKARVSWTPPQYLPSRYLITTGDTRPTDFNAGITVTSTASSRDVGQSPGTTVTYWLVALYETPKVVGPVSVTIRGEVMVTHIDLAIILAMHQSIFHPSHMNKQKDLVITHLIPFPMNECSYGE